MSGFRSIPVASNNTLVEVSANIWTIEAKNCVYFRPPMQPRYPYTCRAIAIRLDDDSLFIISPVELTSDIRKELDSLGVVRYIVSPNQLHHLHMGEWNEAYTEARLYASPGLAAKRKDLTFYKTLSTNTPEPEWNGQIEQCIFGSGQGLFDEIVFFHRPSRTVIFTDLVMDFDPDTFSEISRVTSQWNQMYRHTPRGLQLAHIFDRQHLRNSLKIIRSWEPERAIVAHSPWLCVEGSQEVADLLDSAFDWLKPRPVLVEVVTSIVQLLLLLLVVLPINGFIVLIADNIYPWVRKTSDRIS